MTDQMLRDALERIADRAEPVHGMADRALRAAGRRRRLRVAAATAVAAAAVAAVAVPLSMPDGRESSVGPAASGAAPSVAALPPSTPQEKRLVKGCLREGPRGAMGQVLPGRFEEFRLLARQGGDSAFVALLGNRQGFVMCSGTGTEGNLDMPTLQKWIGPDRFTGSLRVDAIDYLAAPGGGPKSMYYYVAGRAKKQVAEVTVVWSSGRTERVRPGHGFFVAATHSGAVPDKSGDGSFTTPDESVVSVTGRAKDGAVVQVWRPAGAEGSQFVPANCADGVTEPRPALCDP
ncbi:hypothetical protein [Actinomadura verrucosospora]|uniref:Uncharacterized protein n=1 Tax=Actinomadura verrucosospora TaxID=46165 RepID=A0A7D3VWX1_ACTVE|nr:hypothetical protein [Actinomadura verrucosospora]QKG25233.1 hypothetical protein ACTIVE_6884 [Actinomadura verrucosospora]